MTNHPSPQLPEERQLQEVFDETAARPSEAQLARMIARAEQIPAGKHRNRRVAILFPLAAAAVVALALGGAWWAQDRGHDRPVASTAVAIPTEAPSAVPTQAPEPEVVAADDTLDDTPLLPADPLAVLDGESDPTEAWVSELDLLHGPTNEEDDDFWEEMDRLMEEGG